MDKDMLTTFDDDALDQVSGGHGLFHDEIVKLIGSAIEDGKADLANRFERWGTFFQEVSAKLKP